MIIHKVEGYDPSWLIPMVLKQHPDDEELLRAVKGATKTVGFCIDCEEYHPFFVDPDSPDWVYARGVVLNRPGKPCITLDIMRDGRLGSIEDGEAWDRKDYSRKGKGKLTIAYEVCEYDPTWLVKLARDQYPGDEQLLRALKVATKTVGFDIHNREDCTYFEDLDSPEWQPVRSVRLIRPDTGSSAFVEILKNGRVGRIYDTVSLDKKRQEAKGI